MDALKEAIAMLSVPSSIAVGLILLYILMQIIGEIIEFKGKAVPEFFKIRKFFQRRRKEKRETKELLSADKINLFLIEGIHSTNKKNFFLYFFEQDVCIFQKKHYLCNAIEKQLSQKAQFFLSSVG